jgi:hypothetical protein
MVSKNLTKFCISYVYFYHLLATYHCQFFLFDNHEVSIYGSGSQPFLLNISLGTLCE